MISVITRTKNRAFFLPRVFASLRAQTYRPIEWIIVNDAGEPFDELLKNFEKDADENFKIRYVNKESSTTMEAATNAGLEVASGVYINILDDDDTIAKEFYTEAIKHLEETSIDSIRGIVCYTQNIYEKVTHTQTIEYVKTEPFHLRPQNITLSAILRHNQFPIHSFVYYRDVLEKVGLYDETLPVLGDWEFNIRFLKYFDIDVLPHEYVNYHKRIESEYGNTAQNQLDKHHRYEAITRNKILRKHDGSHLDIYMSQAENGRFLQDVFNRDIAQKNQEILRYNSQLVQRDTIVHERNLEILRLREETGEREKKYQEIIFAKETHIKNIEQALEAKETHIKNIEQALKVKESCIKDKDEALRVSAKQIEKLQTYAEIILANIKTDVQKLDKDSRGIGKYLISPMRPSKRKKIRQDVVRIKENVQKLLNVDAEILHAFDIDQYALSDAEMEDLDTKKRLEHFIFFGYDEVKEGRRRLYNALPQISERNYIEAFSDIKQALQEKKMGSAYRHFLKYGASEILRGLRILPKKAVAKKYDYQEPFLREDMAQEMREWKVQPLFSIVMPVYNVDPKWLELAINSIRKQWYDKWELCLADDKSTNLQTLEYLKRLDEPNIKVSFLENNMNISGASNEALKLACGEYIVLMDNDDELTPDALYEAAKAINEKGAEFIYSDEDKIEMDGSFSEPHFKPDFAPDMFLSQNYLSHLGVIKKELVDKVGGWEIGVEGAQDYDLYLKVLEHTDKIVHVDKVLYHWRKIPGSTAAEFSEKSYAQDAGKKALEHALNRRRVEAKVEKGRYPGTYRVRYAIENTPLVSIVIPFKDKPELLDMCVHSILKKSTYKNFEIIGISNNSEEEATFKMMRLLEKKDKRISFHEYNVPFNYSKINNYAVEKFAKGAHVLLLNNDIEIITPDWIEAMLEFSQREDVGCVGAKLYYPNDTIQHAGVAIGVLTLAGHSFRHLPKKVPGYMGRESVIQNVSAVTAACLMVKRAIYDEVGGLNEVDLTVAFNDIDFCLRVLEKGYLNVYTPYCEAYHYESISRGAEDNPEKIARFRGEVAYMMQRHKDILQNGDRFYNKNLTLENENYGLR